MQAPLLSFITPLLIASLLILTFISIGIIYSRFHFSAGARKIVMGASFHLGTLPPPSRSPPFPPPFPFPPLPYPPLTPFSSYPFPSSLEVDPLKSS